MAAAYASLVSVMQILDQLQHHPRPPISLDKQQVESLTADVTFVQEFLEWFDPIVCGDNEFADTLGTITHVAHTIEDVIESHIVDRILADDGEENISVDFYQTLQKEIDNMGMVKSVFMDLSEEIASISLPIEDEDSSTSAADSSSRSGSWGHNRGVVGFNEIIYRVLDEITRQQSSRPVISISGMGGIGKTTLVSNVYEHQLVVERFDFRAWVTISQVCKIRKVLLKLLDEEGENDLSQVHESELGCMVHKKLFGIRYLIILDDIWDVEVWDRLKFFFPDNNNGSRIIVTTRLLKLACEIADSHCIEMSFLNDDESWELFCKHVFGEGDCPIELQGLGKEIVKGCKGLPLSIRVVGGLLAKSPQTQQHWEHIAGNLNSLVNLEDDEHCLQILYMSYKSLPVHLKSCFLYIGVCTEDEVMSMMIVTLWIAEGLVKPICGKILEEVAADYLNELAARNLIFPCKEYVPHLMLKSFILHDLFRDLCLRESQKQMFFCVLGHHNIEIPQNIGFIRRISIANSATKEEFFPLLEYAAPVIRCLKWNTYEKETSFSSLNLRLLKVALVNGMDNLEEIVQQVNLRFIYLETPDQYRLPSSISRFWSLQTLYITGEKSNVTMAPIEIWIMPQLRLVHTDGRLCLPDPPTHGPESCILLENLHTLKRVHNFKCGEEVVKRIPNIKQLSLYYKDFEESSLVDYCFNYLGCLHQLEWLEIKVKLMHSQIVQNLITISFPCSLKFLRLFRTNLPWDDVTTKIGSLPLLEHLDLDRSSCIGAKWETNEGQFSSLKALAIQECPDLEWWMTETTHFPRLKYLFLDGLHNLNEIPSSLGDIPTLQAVYVGDCSDSACDSAERIKEEQEELGNEDLQIQVHRMQRVEEED